VFRRVILPQLRLPIAAGGTLVGAAPAGEYGLFVLMRYDTFATAIVDQFQSVYDGPAANLLGGVLVLCCIVLLGGEALIRGDRRYARIGTEHRVRPLRLRWDRGGCRLLPALCWVAIASIGVTMLTLGRWLWFVGSRRGGWI
jgi:iron(III) transport system permease protein